MFSRRFHSRSSFEPIPNALSELRIQAQKTQKEVAEEIGLSRGVYAMFEAQYAIPNKTLREAICSYYNKTENDIFPILAHVLAASEDKQEC